MKKYFFTKSLVIIFLSLFLSGLSSGCVMAVKRPPRPLAKVEVKPVRPGPKAVWISGHWKWKGNRRHGRWVWIAGHWKHR